MPEPIFDSDYWKTRSETAPQEHHAIYKVSVEEWKSIEERHRAILQEKISEEDSILDAGCAWGRLLYLLPTGWRGDYLGVDLSSVFIKQAISLHPERKNQFVIGDLRKLSSIAQVNYDWAILISTKQMVIGNVGQSIWEQIETELKKVCRRILVLEYSKDDEGAVL